MVDTILAKQALDISKIIEVKHMFSYTLFYYTSNGCN